MRIQLTALLLCLTATAACDDDDGKAKDTAPKPQPAASAASAAPSASASAAAQKPGRPPEPLNVMLISVDSLRADMPWTGYERKIAPNLTKLAEQGVIYENMRSASSYTAQSVATFLSGRWASTLYRTGWFFTGYAKANTFFPEVLQEKGIRTMSAHAHMYFGRGKGMDQGFDVWELVPGITFDPQTDNHVTGEKHTKLIIDMLSKPENVKGQFFLFAHYMDPHDQYVKHEMSPDWGKKNRDRYDSEVFYADHWIGKLLDYSRKQPWWKNTAVIITADHGEAFGDHDMWKHAFEVWDVLVRVPMIVAGPGIDHRRIDEMRSHIDLAPTIMDLMGQKPLDSFQGESLVPELYGAEPKQRDHILVELTADSHNPPRRGIIKGDYKLIVYGKGWKKLLFNLKTDPGEKKDLAKDEPEKLKEMTEAFDRAFEKVPSIKPYGGMKLKSGEKATGPTGPTEKK